MKHALVEAAPNVLLHEDGKLKGQTQASVIFGFEALWEQVAVFRLKGGVTRIRVHGCTADDGCTPIGAEMVFHRIENCNQDLDNALCVLSFRVEGGWVRLIVSGGGLEAACKKGAGEVTDRGYDCGEIVAAVPEAIVRCLVAEDLDAGVNLGILARRW